MKKKVYFMRIIKREKYKELRHYFHYMDYLFDVFSYKPITEYEYEILDYLYKMPMENVENMFTYILEDFTDHELLNELDREPTAMKFLVIQYILKERNEKSLM
jgi:hypothetical protein